MRRFDHVDGDGFNNRLANLRHATRSQNLGNQRRRQRRPPYGATHGASIAIRISTSTSTNPMPACRGRHETPALGRALRRENDRPKLRRVTRSLHAYLARARSRSLDHFVGEHGWQDFEAAVGQLAPVHARHHHIRQHKINPSFRLPE
jgi:hypothetical protein